MLKFSLSHYSPHLTGALLLSLALLSGCVAATTPSSAPPANRRAVQDTTPYRPANRNQGGSDTERLRQVMTPLLDAMDHPCRANAVRMGIMNNNEINAANAGNCEFYVTSGLLRRASDDQLRGVLAHEIAHEDLGHVAKAQVLGAGLNIGMILLEQFFPGSSAFTPIAGTLIAQGYSRQEEYAADRHGMEILQRAGYPPETMERTLEWLLGQEGRGGGGFLSSHPATEDRIAALKR
jgi:predicted Zn-dependent protease